MTAARTRLTASATVTLLLLYAASVLWLTWPLGARMTTHLPVTHPACNFDLLHTAWALAHQTRALVTDPATIVDTNIYHPTRGTLFYFDAAFGALPFFAPPFLATGNPTLATNLTFLAPIVLTATSLHLVVWAWTGAHLAGLVAAWTFLTTRWTLWVFVPTAPQYGALLWIPPIILLAASPRLGWRRWALLAGLVVVQSLSSLVYVGVAVFLPLALLAVWRLLRSPMRAAGVHLVGALLLAGVVLLPFALGYLEVRADNPGLAEQTYWRWWRPTTVLPWGPFSTGDAPTAVPIAALAVTVVGARLASLVRRARPRGTGAWPHAALWAVTGLVISLSPTAFWYDEPLTLPHTLLAGWLPTYTRIREPARLGAIGLVGLALLAGLGFAACTSLVRTRRARALASIGLAVLLVGGMYVEHRRGRPYSDRGNLPEAYPLTRAIDGESSIVRALRRTGGALVELPVGLTEHGCIPGWQARAVYRSIFHWRPLLNGYGGYWPAGFLERMALADRLPAPDALATLRRDTGLETILVHTGDLPFSERPGWLALATRTDAALRLVAREGDDLLFSAERPPQ